MKSILLYLTLSTAAVVAIAELTAGEKFQVRLELDSPSSIEDPKGFTFVFKQKESKPYHFRYHDMHYASTNDLPKGSYLVDLMFNGVRFRQDTLHVESDTLFKFKIDSKLAELKRPKKEIVEIEDEEAEADDGWDFSLFDRADRAEAKRMAPRDGKPSGEGAPAPKMESMEMMEAPATRGGDMTNQRRTAGTLTAGEINDFAKWDLWDDLTNEEFRDYRDIWELRLKQRYAVQVTFPNGKPVVDARVDLVNKDNKIVFSGRTDNTGKAELWAGMTDKSGNQDRYSAFVTFGEQKKSFRKLQAFPEGLNTLTLDAPCQVSQVVDIAFVVDATGSMGDEISYLKTELQDVINRVKSGNDQLDLRLGSVFYRDTEDAYLTRKSDFDPDMSKVLNFIKAQGANGGGDFPEAVDAGMEEALNMKWSPNARARIMFLILDAPPHLNPKTKERMQKIIYRAAAMGVRVIPVTGSGIDKSVEFLMRSMALATNGTYTFLTDHSGVGGKHIAPSTDHYDVEKLNDLMVRLINRYVQVSSCATPDQVDIPEDSLVVLPKDSIDKDIRELTLKCFPVPTDNWLNIEVNQGGGSVFVADGNGKLVKKFDMKERTRIRESLGQLAAGIYHVIYQVGDRKLSRQVVVRH